MEHVCIFALKKYNQSNLLMNCDAFWDYLVPLLTYI